MMGVGFGRNFACLLLMEIYHLVAKRYLKGSWRHSYGVQNRKHKQHDSVFLSCVLRSLSEKLNTYCICLKPHCTNTLELPSCKGKGFLSCLVLRRFFSMMTIMKTFSTRLLLSQSLPNFYYTTGFFCFRCRASHFFLLNLCQFLLAQFPSLSRS